MSGCVIVYGYELQPLHMGTEDTQRVCPVMALAHDIDGTASVVIDAQAVSRSGLKTLHAVWIIGQPFRVCAVVMALQ